jgi:hypothetical protein
MGQDPGHRPNQRATLVPSRLDSPAIIFLMRAPTSSYAKFVIAVQPNPLQEPLHPPIRGCGGSAQR